MSTYKELAAMMEALAWEAEEVPPSVQMAMAYQEACAEGIIWGDLDREVVGLVEALNRVSGIRTIESCCGHDEDPFNIWFNAKSLDTVRPLYEYIKPFRKWHIFIDRNDFGRSYLFELRGPKGERAYQDAERLSEDILRRHVQGIEKVSDHSIMERIDDATGENPCKRQERGLRAG